MARERYRSRALSGHGALSLVLVVFFGLALAGNAADDSSREELLGHARYLASDELAGRAVGSPGIDKARDYIVQKFKEYGLRPGGDAGSYFQELNVSKARAQNVVGFVAGSDPKARGGSIVIGAHYDHIGLGYVGIRSAIQEGKIHNGADDNASGTAVLLSLARRLSESRDKLPRSVVFVAFTAEEPGLYGSKRYVNYPTFPIEETIAMINLDMVGRMRGNRLLVLGVDTAKEFRAWLNEAAKKIGIQIIPDEQTMADQGDHIPFYEENVPILFFFTDIHEDYHQPTDDWEKLNVEGMQMVRDLVLDLTRKIASERRPPTFIRRPSRPTRSDR
jgi:Zn-dependent M28 family amino/carboxypeptidase